MNFKNSHLPTNLKQIQGYIGTMVAKYFWFDILLSNILSNMSYSINFILFHLLFTVDNNKENM